MNAINVVIPGLRIEQLTYKVLEELPKPEIGDFVLCQVQRRWHLGLVIETGVSPPEGVALRPVYYPILPIEISKKLVDLGLWLADYYLCELGVSFQPIVPEYLRDMKTYKLLKSQKRKKPVSLQQVLKGSTPQEITALMKNLADESETIGFGKHNMPEIVKLKTEVPETPTEEQSLALERIVPYVTVGKYKAFLVHGVTGSGKTMLYLWLAQRALNLGKSSLILVPEISLTPQLLSLFRTIMGDKATVYHSGLRKSERLGVWLKVRNEPMVVVGPRSALFLPYKDLGLIVVDEEHDFTYKSEGDPMYNARDTAVYRAYLEGVPIVLGSATPSLESYHNAITGKYTLIKLRKRVKGYWFPRLSVVDQREEKGTSLISLRLLEHLKRTVYRKKQAILYINRRGYAPILLCVKCGFVSRCPFCSVTLTYHKKDSLLRCHICGHAEGLPSSCPRCGYDQLKGIKYGTQRVVSELKNYFKNLIIERLDLDVRRHRGNLEDIVKRMRNGEISILVGTQMLAQGLDFPKVDLIGVLDADQLLFFPDFRADERTVQRLIQVSGRARRGGLVILQTHNTDRPAVKAVAHGKLKEFYENELITRKKFGYPPYKKLISIEFRGKDPEKTSQFAKMWSESITRYTNECEVLGPSPCPIYKISGLFRYRILVKTPKHEIVKYILKQLSKEKTSSTKVKIDVDPYNLM